MSFTSGFKIALGAIGIGVLLASVVYLPIYFAKKETLSPTQTYMERKLAREANTFQTLVSPSEAPEEIRKEVKLGYEIMINTHKYAPAYVGNKLNCTNCHFAGGNSSGGAQNGLSLVGVATKYPTYDKSLHRVIDLSQRINNCFSRSMNGKPVPLDNKIMIALVTYLSWISKDLPIYGDIPWLGSHEIKALLPGDPKRGLPIYTTYCAACHGEDGEGKENNPPLWGDHSFNKGAGFNGLATLSSFIYWNMPYFENTPLLNPQQAFDVAAFVLSHPRPEDNGLSK